MDNYTLPGGQVPKNKLGATTLEDYLEWEGEEVAGRTVELRDNPPDFFSQPLNSTVLKAIHGYLFQDVFEWAGHARDKPFQMSDGTTAVAHRLRKPDGDYFLPGHLVGIALRQFDDSLKEADYLKGLPRKEFADRAADFLINLNNIHPFREGNGRTQRAFFKEIGRQAGHEIDFTVISGERMIQASIAGFKGNAAPMRRLMEDATEHTRVIELKELQGFLIAQQPPKEQHKWNDYYLTTAHPGQSYSGTVAGINKSGTNFLLRDDQRRLVVGRIDDAPHDLRQGQRISFALKAEEKIPFSGSTRPTDTLEAARKLLDEGRSPSHKPQKRGSKSRKPGPGSGIGDD